jgi:hypothetical protein
VNQLGVLFLACEYCGMENYVLSRTNAGRLVGVMDREGAMKIMLVERRLKGQVYVKSDLGDRYNEP